MARPTRQRRRERREEQRAETAAPERARARQQPVPSAEAEVVHPAAARRRGFLGFAAECWGELRKVEWPGQKQVVTGSVVVVIACAIVGAYLWGVDLALEPFVERVLLGQ